MGTKTYTTGEAARAIGVSRQTLQMWVTEGKIAAPKPIELGHMTVRLWTKADLERARKFKGSLKPGPKPKKRKA